LQLSTKSGTNIKNIARLKFAVKNIGKRSVIMGAFRRSELFREFVNTKTPFGGFV
jgi:hypothetical protein